jgi:gliding motility-associated-like protein
MACALLFSWQYMNAQAPAWQVDATKYAYSMVMVGVIKVDGVETASSDDVVAAFINNEVRGVAKPILNKQLNRNVFYLIVYSNESVGAISLKYYDGQKKVVTNSVQTAAFTTDALVGNLDKPFVWSNVATRKEAVLLKYSLTGQYSSRISGDTVIIRVPTDLNKSSLVGSFTISEGAAIYLGKVKQTTDVTTNDFRKQVTVTVRSEDEQTEKQYIIKLIDGEELIPNVLFPNGALRNRTWGISHFGDRSPVSIKVFNSVGQVLFSTVEILKEWDGYHNGNRVPEGVYFYSIDFEDGEKRKGSIQVIY